MVNYPQKSVVNRILGAFPVAKNRVCRFEHKLFVLIVEKLDKRLVLPAVHH